MKCLLAVLCAAAVLAPGAGAEPLVLENRALRLEMDAGTGRLRVLEKASGQAWEQPTVPRGVTTRVVLRQGAAPPRGGKAITITSRMLGDAREVSGDRDCSARVRLSWDERHLYLAADVTDDACRFLPAEAPAWERDSLEVWVNSRQITLVPLPEGSFAVAQGSQRLPGGRIDLARREGGYRVDAAIPWSWAAEGLRPKPGDKLRVAVGVNDADREAREGQIYWPAGWTHSQPNTFAEAVLGDAEGQAPGAAAGADPVYRVLGRKAGSLETERVFDVGGGRRLPLRVRFSLPSPDATDLRVEAAPADQKAPIGDFRFLEPFLLDAPRGVLAVADYSNGHLYPLDLNPFPKGWMSGDRLDMPWVGMCDLGSGRGYLLLLETSDDSAVTMQKVAGEEGRGLVAPAVTWRPQKGEFGYPRSILYHFASKGGYVALCKRYREYARAQGLVVPFSEKVRKLPQLTRLFGAPDVWGDASLSFARQARAAGVEKMLIHGRPGSPEDMKAINDLGYLTSEYDNYTDILPTEDGKITANRATIPDHAVLKADQQRMAAWLTFDKKTQYMKRCPALWVDAAKQVADRVLGEWPFGARFIDVTTAEGRYECYDPAHPLTRGEQRACGPKLIGSFRDRKLVMGGEHGIWWAVPVLDYIEGMQSGGSYSWPAGHLIHPKSKEEEFTSPWGGKLGKWEAYAKWGIGHEWRAPLWELVFHDCVVSTWYWGDASDWLLDAAPEVTPKKDALNILYGTIPLLWANGGGSWVKDRAVFLRTYRNTCKLHEAVAGAEMLSHEYLTPDHAVQRTRFSGGTECVVNFGETPYRATVAGKTYLLPRNGWAVNGPRIEQSLALEGAAAVTTIRAPRYAFTDRTGVPVTLRAEGPGRIRIVLDRAADAVSVRPGEADGSWRPEAALLYPLDDQGVPTDLLSFRAGRDGEISFGPVAKPSSLLLYHGPGSQRADLRVASLELSPQAPRQGDALRVTLTLANAGAASAAQVPVEILIDGRRVHRALATVKSRGSTTVQATLITADADGSRRLEVRLDPQDAIPELSEGNNGFERMLHVQADWSLWRNRKLLRVDAGAVAREDAVVVTPFTLPAGADPASLRVAALDAAGAPASGVPAQLDGGDLCFALPGKLAAGETRRLAVLWQDMAKTPIRVPPLPAPGGSFWREGSKAVVAPGYEARFEQGSLTFLAPRKGDATGANFLKSLIVSSAETGWGDEGSDVKEMRVTEAGPVRTVVLVRKALKTGVVYEKRYAFYARHFEVETSLDKPAGNFYSRAHYALPAIFVDDKGNRAEIDGKGEAENVGGKNPNPKWHALYAPEWAHSCVALSPFDNLWVWDAGALGALGFLTKNGQTSGIRMGYVIHPGAKDASFAPLDYERLTTPVRATWE